MSSGFAGNCITTRVDELGSAVSPGDCSSAPAAPESAAAPPRAAAATAAAGAARLRDVEVVADACRDTEGRSV